MKDWTEHDSTYLLVMRGARVEPKGLGMYMNLFPPIVKKLSFLPPCTGLARIILFLVNAFAVGKGGSGIG
jgi:hypothetical protein